MEVRANLLDGPLGYARTGVDAVRIVLRPYLATRSVVGSTLLEVRANLLDRPLGYARTGVDAVRIV
ncbi:hypothetical protein DWW42_07855, partial [Limosilactobacillus fermentum]